MSQIDANGFSQIDVQIETKGLGLEVMKYGARLVYKQTLKISNKLRLGAAGAASLLMRMILMIQQKIPKLSAVMMTLMGMKLDLVEKLPIGM